MSRRVVFWLVVASGLAVAAALCVKSLTDATAARNDAAASVEFPTQKSASPVDVSANASGVTRPRVLKRDDVLVADAAEVVGITAGSAHRAYLLREFAAGSADLRPEIGRHVVNDVLGGVAVSVTHCDTNRCTRVFRAEGDAPIDLRVGGWDAKAESLVLIHERRRYPQTSADIPLQDLTYEVTTWGEWKSRHPDTTIYIGPHR